MITKRSISKPNSIEEFGEIAISKKKRSFSFSCSRPLSSSQTTTRHTIRPATDREPGLPRMGIEPRHRKPVGWRSGSPKAYPYHSRTARRNPIQAHDLFHTSIHTIRHDCHAIVWHTLSKNMDCILRRKEVIQPHLPVRLPCYDLVPITSLTLDGSPQKVGPPASGATHFHDLTGGVYKARERIHRGVADPRLLATPPSWSRVADSNPN